MSNVPYPTEELRRAARREAQKRYRLAHPERVRETKRHHRRTHRDEVNAGQRERYAKLRIAAGQPYQPNVNARFDLGPRQSPITGTMTITEPLDTLAATATPHTPIIGAMGLAETADSIKVGGGGNGTLEERYLLALMKRDAAIWRKRTCAADGIVSKNEPKGPWRKPSGRPPGPQSKTERANRRAAWTPEKRADARRRSKNSPNVLALYAARAAGEKTYFRPTECKNCGGHLFKTANSHCVQCSRECVKRSQRKRRAKIAAERETTSRDKMANKSARRHASQEISGGSEHT